MAFGQITEDLFFDWVYSKKPQRRNPMRLLICWEASSPNPHSQMRRGVINYKLIVSVFPDFDTAYDFKATVVGPFNTLPVTE